MKLPEQTPQFGYTSTPLVVGPLTLKPSAEHGGIVNVYAPDREYTPLATLMFTGPDVVGGLRAAAAALTEHADAIEHSMSTYMSTIATDTPKEA